MSAEPRVLTFQHFSEQSGKMGDLFLKTQASERLSSHLCSKRRASTCVCPHKSGVRSFIITFRSAAPECDNERPDAVSLVLSLVLFMRELRHV